MINLNHRGLIVPDNNVPSTIEELATVFVWSKPTHRRTDLFGKYLDYMTTMYALLENLSFVQWIDGSFTTTDANSGDIGIVTFINFDVANRLDAELMQFKYPAIVIHLLYMQDTASIGWKGFL